ncbi:hypothetical protein [Polaromonas sp.]|uniref:hypothetical protein n=1 Tax=Polaromonas sp. TaxID=1869339 RepID=UPI0032636AE0
MKKPNLPQYIRSMLAQGQMVQVAAETRRNDGPTWTLREQQHAEEVIRELRMKSTHDQKDQLLITAINPDNGKIGLFEIVKPQPSLAFEAGGTHEADPLSVAGELARIHAEKQYRAGRAAEDIVASIGKSTIKYYEDLAGGIKNGASLETVMSMVAQAGSPPLEIETLSGRYTLGGTENLRKTLPCRDTYRVDADIREIDDDGRPNGTILFKIKSAQSSATELPPVLRSKSRIRASLQTAANAKTLALLHFAKFHQVYVQLELQMEYQIADRGWNICVIQLIDESGLLAKDRPAQLVLSEFW